MSNELVVRQSMALTFDEMTRAAKAMALSGYFTDARDVSQAMVKVMAGAEMGLGPFAAMSNIHVIKGKPVLGANLIATLIKNDARYDYRVLQLDDAGCVLAFYEHGELVGEASFTAEDARKAGLNGDNWKKFPRNMYFARAISNGAKWYTPGIFGGAAVYTPDELGAEMDEEGYVIKNITPPRQIDEDTGEIVERPVVASFDELEPAVPANGNQPFYGAVAHKVAYYQSAEQVQEAMELLGLSYPADKDTAKAAQAVLEHYAGLLADGVPGEQAVALATGAEEVP